MKRKVLITGGAGLIGMHLAETLLEHGHSVVCFDLAEQLLRRKDDLKALQEKGDLKLRVGTIMDRWGVNMATQGMDTVVHLAAMLGVQRTERNRLLCMDINVNGTDVVLSACARNDVEHIVLASSSEVYGEPTVNPVTEDVETKGKTVYAVSKLAAEELVKGYHQVDPALGYTIVRFFNTYGEGQVAQFVLSRFVQQVLAGRSPQVYGDGKQTRSYCHVSDAVAGLRAIIENPASRGEVFNIGNSEQVYDLNQLAARVIEVLAPGSGLKVEHVEFGNSDRTEGREIFERYCDTAKAARVLHFKPRISVEEGVRRIVAASAIHEDWNALAGLL